MHTLRISRPQRPIHDDSAYSISGVDVVPLRPLDRRHPRLSVHLVVLAAVGEGDGSLRQAVPRGPVYGEVDPGVVRHRGIDDLVLAQPGVLVGADGGAFATDVLDGGHVLRVRGAVD